MVKMTDDEMRAHAFEMLSHAHHLLGVQCQNCRHYKPDEGLEDMDNYRGTCVFAEEFEHKTYWSQYCDDFMEGTYEKNAG